MLSKAWGSDSAHVSSWSLLSSLKLLGLHGKIMITEEENHSKPLSCNVLRQDRKSVV